MDNPRFLHNWLQCGSVSKTENSGNDRESIPMLFRNEGNEIMKFGTSKDSTIITKDYQRKLATG